MENTQHYLLPVVKGNKRNAFPSVSVDTVASLIVGTLKPPEGRRVIIIDCRFPYEFNGGHIRGAVNITGSNVNEQLLSLFINQRVGKHILLFHCEFSKSRAPHTMELLRQIDRTMNEWPRITYDQMYLIHNGYLAFHTAYPALCEPVGAYIPMATKGFCRPRSRSIREQSCCALQSMHGRSRSLTLNVRSFKCMLETANEEEDTDKAVENTLKDNIDDYINGTNITPRPSSHLTNCT